ncbi:MAG: hypothetical protein KDA88_03315 [Planctomycetaceae bacterium]|nr:hypothetical protein [Planctomycetaceae bacterium]
MSKLFRFLSPSLPTSKRLLSPVMLAAVVLGWLLCPAHAQETDSPPAVPVAEAADSSGDVEGENVIYVPFSRLKGTFEEPDASVVLPYEEYLKLRKQWELSQKQAGKPGVVLTQADYVAVVENDFATVKLTLKAHVAGDAWSSVPVNFGGAAIGSVEGDDVLIRGTGNGTYELLFGKTGDQTVVMELGTRVHQSPNGRQFGFSIPAVGVQTLDLTVPDADQTVDIRPGGKRLPIENPIEKTTQVRTTMMSADRLDISWRAKASQKPEMDLLASVDNRTLVTIADGLIHTDCWLTYGVLRGKLAQAQIVVPAGHRILDINSDASIRSWKPTDANGHQVVDIELVSPSDKPVTFEVHTQRKLPDEGFDVIGMNEGAPSAGIHALDAVRESGQVVVRHAKELSLNVASQSGLIRIEQSAVDPRLAGENDLAFKFYSQAVKLGLDVQPVEPRLTATHNIEVIFTEDELQSRSSINYAIERAGVFELRLKVPDDFTVDHVQCGGMKEYNVDEQTRVLTISLHERTQGAVEVRVSGTRRLSDDNMQDEQQLPLLEPLNLVRETGSVLVFAKEAIEVITNRDDLVGAQPLPTGPQSRGEARLASAWSFTKRPLTIPVSTIRKPTRISVEVASTIDVQPEVTDIRHVVDFLVEYAGTDIFQIDVPEAVSDRIEIEVAEGSSTAIKQKTAEEPIDGWVPWTIVMQREVVGHQQFVITWQETSNGEDEVEADDAPAEATEEAEETDATPATVYSLVRPWGLINEDGEEVTPLVKIYGEIAIKKERSLSLNSSAEGESVEPIDIREFRLLPADGMQGYRYFKLVGDSGTPTVSISRERHEIQEVVATVVSRALVEVVTDEDAEVTYRCRLRVKSTERQRLQINLPVEMQVLGTFVNNREVKLAKAKDEERVDTLLEPYWINVARTTSSDEPFLITVQFLWKLNPPLGQSQFGAGRIDLPLPVLGTANGQAAVQEMRVVSLVPEEYMLVGDPKNFELQKARRYLADVVLGSRPDPDVDEMASWVQEGCSHSTDFMNFPTSGRQAYVYTNLGGASLIRIKWWHRLTMTLILSGAVALIGLILIGTPWENKLGILLLAGFGAVLYGVQDSHSLYCGMEVAQYGLIALLGLWVLHGVFGWFRAANSTNGKPAPQTAASGPQNPLTAPPVVPPPGSFDDPWKFGN